MSEHVKNPREVADTFHLAAVEKELLEYKQAFPCCDTHKPNGGARSECLECFFIRLSSTLSRIDYAVGQPNEMGLSLYDTECDEDAVLLRVSLKVANLEAALRANTKWLNTLGPDLSDPDCTRITHKLIAINEAVLGGVK